MLSIIITSKDEPKTIAKAIKCIVDRKYSGIIGDFELITVISGEETKKAASVEMQKHKDVKWTLLTDEYKGKPYALNKALGVAKGSQLLLTDGDVYFEQGAVGLLQKKMVTNSQIGGVTGRAMSSEDKSTMWKYFGYLLSDGAHHKRMSALTDAEGYSKIFVKKSLKFFPLSGYIALIKNYKGLSIPEDCLIDDAYISYWILNKGEKIAYEPEAKVFVKYPGDLVDWMSQKIRSVGGYVQLWKYGVVTTETKVRNFWKELEYFWFPIKYASSPKELIWSLVLYPLRLWMWIKIYWERKVLKKDFSQTWVPIQSTK